MHFKEKPEQRQKLESSLDVINTLEKMIERQQDDEVRAIYGSGPYKLSNEYNRFLMDNLNWHSMTLENVHVLAFRNYNPSLEDNFIKPAKSGRKPSDQARKRKQEPDVLINWLESQGKQSQKKYRWQIQMQKELFCTNCFWDLWWITEIS